MNAFSTEKMFTAEFNKKCLLWSSLIGRTTNGLYMQMISIDNLEQIFAGLLFGDQISSLTLYFGMS